VFLYGYPRVQRMSTGVHDPLLVSALYVSDGVGAALFACCDVLWVARDTANRVRERIAQATGIAPHCITITATHTHSGPVTERALAHEADPVVPPPDTAYLHRLEQAIVDAATRAVESAGPAELAIATADGTGLGANRHDPAGPAIPEIPILTARRRGDGSCIGLMAVVAMHPTVLHEDSTLISGDFPGIARQYLKRGVLAADCPVLFHLGAAGDQSPRHVVRGNTLAEAERLGRRLADAVTAALADARPVRDAAVTVRHAAVDLPVRRFTDVSTAEQHLTRTRQRFERLRARRAPRAEQRTAECDVFGAEELVHLCDTARDGRIGDAARACTPAEVQVIRIGDVRLVAWPGEVFAAFALTIMRRCPSAWVMTLANGHLQGYLVTSEAVEAGTYEASNAIFQSPAGGDRLVEATLGLLAQTGSRPVSPSL
jgi:hypothetical protein